MNISTEYPIKVKKSNLYLLVIEIQDKCKTTHYWLPNGQYDGYCRETKDSKDSKDCRQINA